MRRDGLTLLETMVALVILGLVVLGYLEIFGATARVTRGAETWTRAVTYAEQGMELAKLDPRSAIVRDRETLDNGFQRWVEMRPWGTGVQLVTVTVALPRGGQFKLQRLVEAP